MSAAPQAKAPPSAAGTAPTDLELAALISSKLCHDVIGPVGAIVNGVEILNEDEDAQARSYALNVIRDVAEQASARLQFARFAFGAAGSAGAMIDLGSAEKLARGYVGKNKHKLTWKSPAANFMKDHVKLLLNLVASAVTALPRGGDIDVNVTGTAQSPLISIRCKGVSARPPNHLVEFLSGGKLPPLDAMNIQPYYTVRLAQASGLRLEVSKDGADVLLIARP